MFISLRRMMQNAIIRRSTHAVANYEVILRNTHTYRFPKLASHERVAVAAMEHAKTYKDAIKALHNLQSNAAYLQAVAKQDSQSSSAQKLKDTEKYLIRSGITLEQLDDLSIIHVAGTKGKGSTCAFAEAILRKHSFNTGFFSSPHLITVRERIRINGQPISELYFTCYFWKVYKRLENAKEYETDMPTYFNFLTILMFHIFLEANIDVAIIEVGIGGEKDCTNIVRNPVCVGITSLGLDHTSLLGNTLEEIAYQKSGIFKPGTTAFTVPQPLEAMRVLEKRAIEKNCLLYIAPPYEDYSWDSLSPILGVAGNVQRQNASLAIQLASKWITSKRSEKCPLSARQNNFNEIRTKYSNGDAMIPFQYADETFESISMNKVAIGISSCKWPGRTQVLRTSVADFFLDGAHTIESIECCISWFKNATTKHKGQKFLIFNITGKRSPDHFLTLLKSLKFQKAYFVPNFAGVQTPDDTANCTALIEQKINCQKHFEIWGPGAILASSVLDVLQDIKEDPLVRMNSNTHSKTQILVTGSLHLVGAVLTILDPNLTMNSKF